MKLHHYSFLFTLGLATAANAQSSGVLDINNIRARFNANGLISLDPGTQSPGFEVPIGSGAHSLYSAGLWLGGLSLDSQLKLAAVMYPAADSGDWYTGPLTTSGDASIDDEVMQAYDHVWQVNTADVALYQAYCTCLATPGCDVAVEFPGYTMPVSFNSWPALGEVGAGQDLYLAPFNDFNSDGDYDPGDCDAPCAPGDQSLYFIFNDKGYLHQESGGQPIGVEVQARPFAFDGPTAALSNTIFVEYRIINRGTQTLNDTYLGLFTDFDLGCPLDDYIGCDVGRSLWYGYNGDANDEDCIGEAGYNTDPPAFGATVLCGPFADPDNVDWVGSDSSVAALNGYGTGDAIIDNEHLGLSRFMYFDNGLPATGDPSIAQHYYNYLRGIWKDGLPLSYGANGYGGITNARFAYPGDSDPQGLGTGGAPQAPWSEVSAGNLVGDRRGLGSMGPFTLEPGAINRVSVAFVFARGSGGPQASIAALQARVDTIRAFAEAEDFCGGLREDIPCHAGFATGIRPVPAPVSGPMSILPSVASDMITLHLPSRMINARIEVIDATGRRVAVSTSRASSTIDVRIADLASGSYAITAELNGEKRTGRFVKE